MSRSHAALIVDADPQGLESLVYGFQGADWRITACPVPETASLLVRASGAEIVVIASRGDHEKTHALLRHLRGQDAFRALPILVLGPEELRSTLKECGDVDLLPLPAFVRDVLTACQMLVEAGMAATQNPGDDPRYQGLVTPAGTLSLIRTMNGLARSGLLRLDHADRHGEIWFHEGELTAAQFGQLEGGPAIHHVLLWDDGTLELLLRPVSRRGQLHQTAHEYLEDLGRFQRDFAHASKGIGPTATVYRRNEERLSQSAGEVPAEVTPVVRLCDGHRRVSDVIDESPFRALDTVGILDRLVELGILVRAEPRPEIETTVARTSLDEFWETARIVGPASSLPTPARIGGTPAPVQVPSNAEPDRRDESATRREGERRGRKQTLDLGMPSEPSPPVSATTASPPPETPSPANANDAAPGTRASGTLEVRKADRRAQPRVQPRVQIGGDLAAIVIDTQDAPTARAPAPPQQAPSPNAAPEPTKGVATRITGVLEATSSGRTTRPTSAPGRISIQLDASLVSEAEGQSSSREPVADAKTEPRERRVTGELQVAPSEKSPRRTTKAERGSSSFQIDPSLAEPPSPVPAPAAHQETRHRPSGGVPVQNPHGPHRPSGGFSAIESDFFAREADLYKQESTESFTDLEEDRAKAGLKKTGPATKAGKTQRK
jgi:DNA-binding response OmpR family regulator